jgi:hypothetical protein
MFEQLVARYRQEQPDQSVIITTDVNVSPTLFRQADNPGTTAVSLRVLFDALDADNYLFLSISSGASQSRLEEMTGSDTQMPVTFIAPTYFMNTYLVSVADRLSLSQLIADGMLDPDAMEIYGVTMHPDEDPVRMFFDERLSHLASTTKRLREVQAGLPGFYAVFAPEGFDRINVHCLDNLWSVNAAAENNQQLAAQLFLGFLLGDFAQNMMSLQMGVGIPVNIRIFQQFIDINPDLEFVRDMAR